MRLYRREIVLAPKRSYRNTVGDTMVTVGVLAMVVNVVVLVTVTVADRFLEVIVRNFATSRLHRTRRAPVVHDSDTWLPNIPRSIVKYHRHPAILATVLCTVFLIASELVTELGVDVTERCNPVLRKGTVIDPGDSSDSRTPVELGAAAFFLQTVTFLDGPLTRVTSGMPKRITGKECLPCLYEEKHEDIVVGCHVRRKKYYKAGELRVGVISTKDGVGTRAVGFNETDGKQTKFTGMGDLTRNGDKNAIFVFAYPPDDQRTKELQYFEYGSQAHSEELLEEARKSSSLPVWARTKSRVGVWSITCDLNVFSQPHFQEALMFYRTIQLENPTKLAVFNDTAELFEPISEEDVYRSILSMKVIDDNNVHGEYHEYTVCARYKWEFLVPIFVCVGVILALGFWSSIVSSRYKNGGVPYNSKSWFRHCQRVSGTRKSPNDPSRSGYFDTLYEEMVLVDGGSANDQRILFRSRSMGTDVPDVDVLHGHTETTEEAFEGLEPRVDEGTEEY